MEEHHLERLTLYLTVYGLVFELVGAATIVLPILIGIEMLTLMAWLLVLGSAVTLVQFVLICDVPGTTSFLLLGALHVASRAFLLIQPDTAFKRLVFVFVGWFIVHGIVKLLMSYKLRRVTTWPGVFVNGVSYVGLGVVVLGLFLMEKFSINLVGIFFRAYLIGTGGAMLLISCMAYLGQGHRSVIDSNVRNEPLLDGRGPNAAAYNA